MTRTEPCDRAWCPFLACATCAWKGGDPQGALLDITAGQGASAVGRRSASAVDCQPTGDPRELALRGSGRTALEGVFDMGSIPTSTDDVKPGDP